MFSAASVLASGAVDEIWFSPCGGDPLPSPPPPHSSSCLSQRNELEKLQGLAVNTPYVASAASSSLACHAHPSSQRASPTDNPLDTTQDDGAGGEEEEEERAVLPHTEKRHRSSGGNPGQDEEEAEEGRSSLFGSKKIRMTEATGDGVHGVDRHASSSSSSSLEEGKSATRKKQKGEGQISEPKSAERGGIPRAAPASTGAHEQSGTYKVRPDKALSTPAKLRLEMLKLAVRHFFGEAVQVVGQKRRVEAHEERHRDGPEGCTWEKPKIHVRPTTTT